MTGTSVASAIVAGGCALLLSAIPDLGLAELRKAAAGTRPVVSLVPRNVATYGNVHFYRILKYLVHARQGDPVDQDTAQAIVDRHLATLKSTDGRPLTMRDMQHLGPKHRVGLLDALSEALRYAPWSASLHVTLALLQEHEDPAASLALAQEALRLDWADVEAHRLLSRLLVPIDTHAAVVEQDIACLLEEGLELQAAGRLYDGQAERRAEQATWMLDAATPSQDE